MRHTIAKTVPVFQPFLAFLYSIGRAAFLIAWLFSLGHTGCMKIRPAQVGDVETIHALISDSAEHDLMLFRSLSDVFENLQTFLVACEEEAGVIGCCALEVIWKDLAEVKSVAVHSDHRGKGIGRHLVQAALAMAVSLGLPKVFTLTLEPQFFERLGFLVVEKDIFPMKVWRDCARCPKQDHCDEIAMIINVA